MALADSDSLTTRYGRRRPTSRRAWVVVAAVLLVIGVAWSWWAGQAQADRPVTARVQSYSVTSEHEIALTIQIYARDGAAARCDASAQAADHSTVGERVVTLPASTRDKYVVRTTISTERRAVTGDVTDCRLVH